MTQPFLSSSLSLWLDLIEQAVRLRNPKVTDFGPLKKAAERARKATFPRIYQVIGPNPFMSLIVAAQNMPRGDQFRRDEVIDLGCQALATLIDSEIRHPDKSVLVELAGRDFKAFRERAMECVSHAAYRPSGDRFDQRADLNG